MSGSFKSNFNRRIAVTTAAVWQLAAIAAACLLLAYTWPNSVFSYKRARDQAEEEILFKVRAKSLELLRQGSTVLTAWNESHNGGKFVTSADMQTIQSAFKLANEIGVDSDEKSAFKTILTTQKLKVLSTDLCKAIGGLCQAITNTNLRTVNVIDRSSYQRSSHLTIDALTPGERADAEALLAQAIPSVNSSLLGSDDLDAYARIACFGTIGAALRAVMSMMIYWGSQRFLSRWFGFYLIRPIEGAILSVALYLVLPTGGSAAASSPKDSSTNSVPSASLAATTNTPAKESGKPSSGNYALALMAGLFVGEAKKKLQTVATGLFESARNEDHLDDANPIIHATRPIIGPSFWAGSLKFPDIVAALRQVSDVESEAFLFKKLSTKSQYEIEAAVRNPFATGVSETLVAALNELLTAGSLLDKAAVKRARQVSSPPSGPYISSETLDLFERLPEKPAPDSCLMANLRLLLDVFGDKIRLPDSWEIHLLGTGFQTKSSVTVDGEPVVEPGLVKYLTSDELSLVLRGPKYSIAKPITVIVINPAHGEHSEPFRIELSGLAARLGEFEKPDTTTT